MAAGASITTVLFFDTKLPNEPKTAAALPGGGLQYYSEGVGGGASAVIVISI
jgi:hypothetical protein